jgi:hypothetical protein
VATVVWLLWGVIQCDNWLSSLVMEILDSTLFQGGKLADALRGQKRTGGPRRQTVAMSEKREDIQLDLEEDHRQPEDR